MSKKAWFEALPEVVQRELHDALNRVSGWESAQRLWDRFLTNFEQTCLGNNLEEAYKQFGGAIGMWRKLHPVTKQRAIIELAYKFDFLTEPKRAWLLREIGEAEPLPASDVLSWNRDTGELFYGKQLIRRIASPQRATNIVAILNAFQEEGWPRRIDDPLPRGSDTQRLREAIRTLNLGLERIHFRADGSGEGIIWEVADTHGAPTPHP